MPRARSGKTVTQGRKRLKKKVKGYHLSRGNLIRQSLVTLIRGRKNAVRDRRTRKRNFRRLWIVRVSAGCAQNGINYSQFIAGLQRAMVELDRKTLADLAIHDAPAFTKLVELAKQHLPAPKPVS
jgi:large subunit ribosomal protein L20